jgi:DNA-binding CsgD family transcriptional regulator
MPKQQKKLYSFIRNKKAISEELSSSSQSSLVAAEQLLSTYSSKPLESAAPLVGATSANLAGATTVTNRSKRPSNIQLAATLRKIRQLLAEGYTNKEIIEMLQLEERTFYRYMRRIYAQDKAYFEKQDNESIATEIRVAKERTLKSLRRFDAIAADETLSPTERMEAERNRMDVIISLAKIEVEGPRIVHDTSRRLYDRLYKQQ